MPPLKHSFHSLFYYFETSFLTSPSLPAVFYQLISPLGCPPIAIKPSFIGSKYSEISQHFTVTRRNWTQFSKWRQANKHYRLFSNLAPVKAGKGCNSFFFFFFASAIVMWKCIHDSLNHALKWIHFNIYLGALEFPIHSVENFNPL